MATKINMKNVESAICKMGNTPMYDSNGKSLWNATLKTNVIPLKSIIFRGTTIFSQDYVTATVTVDLLEGPHFTSSPSSDWKMMACNKLAIEIRDSHQGHTPPNDFLGTYVAIEKIEVTSSGKTFSATPTQLKSYYIGARGNNMTNWLGVRATDSVKAIIYTPCGATKSITLKPGSLVSGTRGAYIWHGQIEIPFNSSAFTRYGGQAITKNYI
jgi:hypothetical protein